MKIGFSLLLWTANVQSEHWPIPEDIKRVGYDGVEIPVFEGAPAQYAELGRRLESLGLEPTGTAVFPSLDMNPIGAASEQRAAALKHIDWIIECSAALGAKVLGGPLHSTLGHFSGEAPTAVARRMGLYTNRIFIFLAAYRSGGWQALRARKAMGRPKRLEGKQIQWIYQTVTSKNPLQFKLPFALWTRAQIRTLIARRFGVTLSLVSVGRLLAQLGLTCQKPLFRAYQQDRSLVERWLEEESPKIRAQAKREKAERLKQLLELAAAMPFRVELWEAQTVAYEPLAKSEERWRAEKERGHPEGQRWLDLLAALRDKLKL